MAKNKNKSAARATAGAWLLPMHVQCLVGLCCVRATPNAVDVTVGDMVMDEAAAEERDVDVTVTMLESDGTVRAFKAYEVKKESRTLGVGVIEQLWAKLNDMPSITHRCVVSVSGYSNGARRKAAYHGLELFALRLVTGGEFSMRVHGRTINVRPGRRLLCWKTSAYRLHAPNGPRSFSGNVNGELRNPDGSAHSRFRSPAGFEHEILQRSTEMLFTAEPFSSNGQRLLEHDPGWAGPEWPYSHTVDLRADNVYIQFEGHLIQVEAVELNGVLQWRIDRERHAFYVLERDSDREMFASALITIGERPEQLYALVAAPDSNRLDVRIIRLEEKHLEAIRRLKVAQLD